jgi:hypothetical protein
MSLRQLIHMSVILILQSAAAPAGVAADLPDSTQNVSNMEQELKEFDG